MKIEHIALWAIDIELLKDFYVKHFNGVAGEKYKNPLKNFESYFISFSSGCRLEIMSKSSIKQLSEKNEITGFAHLAFCVGNESHVVEQTLNFQKMGIRIVSEPRRTGDGYFESVILDPEGNYIELVAEK